MAKIRANTVSDVGFSNVRAQHGDPSGDGGRIAAALAAGARPFDTMNANIERLTRQRLGNIDARTREIQAGLHAFAQGVSALGAGIDKIMDARADEEAENALTKYREHMLMGREADYAVAPTGDLALDGSDPKQLEGVNGPYIAVRKRMAEFNDLDAYRNLSSRAREKFDEKRKRVDAKYGEDALEAHVAALTERRDADAAANYTSKAGEAARDFLDTTGSNPFLWKESANDAIEYKVNYLLRKARRLDVDGKVVEGSEAFAAQVRAKVADEVYAGMLGAAAQQYAATDDEAEAAALYNRMFYAVAAKAGHDIGENENLGFEKRDEATKKTLLAEHEGTKGLPLSEASARAGWDAMKKADRQRTARLNAERTARLSKASDLAYEVFKAGGQLPDRAIMQQLGELKGTMNAKDLDIHKEEVDGWYFNRRADSYDRRIEQLRNMADPGKQKREAEAIRAEVKEIGDPKLEKAVNDMLSGGRRGATKSSEKFSWAEIQDMMLEAGAESAAQKQTVIDGMIERGEITRDTWRKANELLHSDAMRKVDLAEIYGAMAEAGLDVSDIIAIDKDSKMPVMKDGKFVAADPAKTASILSWTDATVGAGTRVPDEAGVVSLYDEGTRHYAEITHETLARVVSLAAEWMTNENVRKPGETLPEFIKRRCVHEIGILDEERLRVQLRNTEKTFEVDAANGRLSTTGRN